MHSIFIAIIFQFFFLLLVCRNYSYQTDNLNERLSYIINLTTNSKGFFGSKEKGQRERSLEISLQLNFGPKSKLG